MPRLLAHRFARSWELLASRHFVWFIIATAILLGLPTLDVELFGDDLVQQDFLRRQHAGESSAPWWNMFSLVEGPRTRNIGMRTSGRYPWWVDPNLHIVFFRPLTGARPTSIQAFSTDGFVGYSVAWVYDSATTTPVTPWVLKAGQTEAEIMALLGDPKLRPISLSSRRRAGDREYAAIFVPSSSPTSWAASLAVPNSDLASEIADRWDDGFYPASISAEQADSTRVNVLWSQRPPGISVQARLNLTAAAFDDEDAHWRGRGYHLETVDKYTHGGMERRAAVWVRYQPYLRWQGTQYVPGDANYETKYKMFHDQAVKVIANLTDVDCSGGETCPQGSFCYSCEDDSPCFYDKVCANTKFGQYTMPSATLHIFEGSKAVLNRAYTYGPAIYPETPLDASFKGGSVAKSLTATAVVRELDLRGLPMNMSFAEAIGVADTYPLEITLSPFVTQSVRVRDVLSNRGGFPGPPETPNSYLAHSVIADAGAAIPIDGKDLLNYVFAPPPNGRINIGTMHGDSYWQSEWFEEGYASGVFRYSNSGYSLLGELIRVQSGVPYEKYVSSQLLAPLSLEDRIYPDRALRAHSRGPSLTSIGEHLVDTSHPYNIGSPDPQQPRQGLEENPVEPWTPYVGPHDPRAPARASSRYGGQIFRGGAPLAAGGWWVDGDALVQLIRTISRTDLLLPLDAADWLWHPALWNFDHGIVNSWAYVHGWYVRGNWVGWLGSDQGATAIVLHNRIYDVTIAFLANGLGQPATFINPLMESPNLTLHGSRVGQIWPCTVDPSFEPLDTCALLPVSALY